MADQGKLYPSMDPAMKANAAQLAARNIKDRPKSSSSRRQRPVGSLLAATSIASQPSPQQSTQPSFGGSSTSSNLFGGSFQAPSDFNFSAPVQGLKLPPPSYGHIPSTNWIPRGEGSERFAGDDRAMKRPFGGSSTDPELKAKAEAEAAEAEKLAKDTAEFEAALEKQAKIDEELQRLNSNFVMTDKPAIITYVTETKTPSSTDATKPATPSNPKPQTNNVFGAQTPAPQKSSIFSTQNTTAPTSSIFGTQTPAPEKSSVFGTQNTTAPTSSVFGAQNTTASTSNIFGTQTPAPEKSSVFGTQNTSAPTSSVFGAQNTTASTSNIFGTQTPAPEKSSVFGTQNTSAPTSSVFGAQNTTTSTSNIFGTQTPAPEKSSVFGTQNTTAPTSSVFGAQNTTASTSNIFGTQNNAAFPSSSVFANPTPTTTGNEQSRMADDQSNPQMNFCNNTAAPPTSNFFGTQNALATNNVFGTSSGSNAFQTSNVFGTPMNNTNNVFGMPTNNPTFGTPQIFNPPPMNGQQPPQGSFSQFGSVNNSFGTAPHIDTPQLPYDPEEYRMRMMREREFLQAFAEKNPAIESALEHPEIFANILRGLWEEEQGIRPLPDSVTAAQAGNMLGSIQPQPSTPFTNNSLNEQQNQQQISPFQAMYGNTNPFNPHNLPVPTIERLPRLGESFPPHIFQPPPGIDWRKGPTEAEFQQLRQSQSNQANNQQSAELPRTDGLFGRISLPPQSNQVGNQQQSAEPPRTDGLFGRISLPPQSNQVGSQQQSAEPPRTDGLFGRVSLPPQSNQLGNQQQSAELPRTDGLFGRIAVPDQSNQAENPNSSKELFGNLNKPVGQSVTEFRIRGIASENNSSGDKPASSSGAKSATSQSSGGLFSPVKPIDTPASASQPPPNGMFGSLTPAKNTQQNGNSFNPDTPIDRATHKRSSREAVKVMMTAAADITEAEMNKLVPAEFDEFQRKYFYQGYRLYSLNRILASYLSGINQWQDPQDALEFYTQQRKAIECNGGFKRKSLEKKNDKDDPSNKRPKLDTSSSKRSRLDADLDSEENQENENPSSKRTRPSQPTISAAAPVNGNSNGQASTLNGTNIQPSKASNTSNSSTSNLFKGVVESPSAAAPVNGNANGQASAPNGNNIQPSKASSNTTNSSTSSMFKDVVASPSTAPGSSSPQKKMAPLPASTPKQDTLRANPFGGLPGVTSPIKSSAQQPATSPNTFSTLSGLSSPAKSTAQKPIASVNPFSGLPGASSPTKSTFEKPTTSANLFTPAKPTAQQSTNTPNPSSSLTGYSSPTKSGSSTPSVLNEYTPGKPVDFGAGSNIFGFLKNSPVAIHEDPASDDDDENTQPQVDNTWKAGSQIKFGSNSLLPPAAASATTSRDTTPGATTDGDNSTDGDAEQEDAQIVLTAGGRGEEDEEVVHEVRARALKFNTDKEEGDDSNAWRIMGTGPLRVLKHKETAVTRMLLRADPSGTIIMNKALISTAKYEAKSKTVQVLAAGDDGKGLESWLLQVKTAEAATALAEILEENK